MCSGMQKSADISVDISHSRCLGKYHIIWQKHPVAESADLMESPNVRYLYTDWALERQVWPT